MTATEKDAAEQLLAMLHSLGEQNVETITVSTAATISTPDEFTTTIVDLTGSATITLPVPTGVGQRKVIYFVQDATGGRVITFAGATVNYQKGSAPVLSTAANAVDVITLVSLDGTTWRGNFVLAPSAAYTKTLSTVARTIPVQTAAAVVTTPATNSSPYGFSQAQANALVASVNATIADVLAYAEVIVGIVTDLEARGILG